MKIFGKSIMVALTVGAATTAQAQQSVGEAFTRPPCTDGRPVSAAIQQANATVARNFVEQGLGRGDMTAFDRYVASDVWVSTGLKPEAPITSREEYRQIVATTLGVALSATNATMDIQEVLPTLDGRVIVRFVAHADHVGELYGIPATNRRLTLSETHLYCVRNGLIVENYVGALNPLQWEMIYAPEIAPKVLP